MISPHELPALLRVADIRARLAGVFPESFPDRGLLVGDMAARVVFVFLYGGFIAGQGPRLRPSYVYFFTERQARKTSDAERFEWCANAPRPGYRPDGARWYADNSRESIRDDLVRGQLIHLGIVGRAGGQATTSSRPIYGLNADFAALLSPSLTGAAFDAACEDWRQRRLDPGVLSRMRLRTQAFASHASDVLVDMPDGTRIRLAAGPSSPILKAIIEQFAPKYLGEPAVLWISASDKKTWPEFVARARQVGLHFSPSNELPDLILVDLDETRRARFMFCEVVATDGPITVPRRGAFMRIVQASCIPPGSVEFLSVFADRGDATFRKSFSKLPVEGLVWFSSEPRLIVRMEQLR